MHLKKEMLKGKCSILPMKKALNSTIGQDATMLES